MAEEKTKEKKAGIVKRILKWFSLTVLSVLIILGLIFEAPWKVITILLIVLAACRILPKPAIKWFWLSVGVVVLVLIIWVFLPENTEGWKQYKYNFDKEKSAIEAAHAIADEENAATIYNQLLTNYDANALEPIFDPNYYDLIISTPWSSQDYPELAKWLKRQQGTIAKLFEASKIEKCRFPISDPTNIEPQIDRNAAIRRWAPLLVIASNNDLAEGRIDQAIEKSLTALQMAKHQYQQPTMIDMLGGMATEALTIRSFFNSFVVTADATEEHLSIIEKALIDSKHDWSYDFPQLLEHEKLGAKNNCANFYKVNPKGKIRLSRDPLAQMRTRIQQSLQDEEIEEESLKELFESIAYPSYLEKKLIKADTIFKWFYMPSTPQKAGEIIDESFEKYYAMANPDFDWQKEPREFSITSLFSTRARFNYRYEKSYHHFHDLYLRVISDQRGSQLLIGLRRYKNKNGHWPENLEDIKSFAPAEIFVDPINNNSFVYKHTEENFTLYSKGKNNIDENGEYNSTWDPNSFEDKVEEDDWLIWPPRSRKTQEKKADAEQQ